MTNELIIICVFALFTNATLLYVIVQSRKDILQRDKFIADLINLHRCHMPISYDNTNGEKLRAFTPNEFSEDELLQAREAADSLLRGQ